MRKSYARRITETASTVRPFCRRALRMFRPPGVRDLTKKPCFVARFFLFGLYVNDIVIYLKQYTTF